MIRLLIFPFNIFISGAFQKLEGSLKLAKCSFFFNRQNKKRKARKKKKPTLNTSKVYLKTPETTTWGETINTISSDYILLIKIIKSDLYQSSQILKKEVSKYTLFSFFFLHFINTYIIFCFVHPYVIIRKFNNCKWCFTG